MPIFRCLKFDTASMQRKCFSFDFEAKLKLMETVEKEGKTKAEICRENGIAQSSLSTILNENEKIRTAVEKDCCHYKKPAHFNLS